MEKILMTDMNISAYHFINGHLNLVQSVEILLSWQGVKAIG